MTRLRAIKRPSPFKAFPVKVGTCAEAPPPYWRNQLHPLSKAGLIQNYPPRNPGLKMRIRNLFIGLALSTILGLLTVAFSPKHSAQIFFGQLLAESGHHTQTTQNYGTHPKHKLDIFEPTNKPPGQLGQPGAKNNPVILFLYGGGWREGKREIYQFVGAAFAKRGYTTIIPDYRTFPEVSFPGFIDDAARAYHYIWKNISEGRPIIVMGHSAGAHSAAMIALDPKYIAKYDRNTPRPSALIGISGPYAFNPTTWATTKDIFATAPNADAARPAAHVDQNAPPALLLHGLKDTTVRLFNLKTMAKNYQTANRPIVTKTYDNLAHIDIILTIAQPLRWRASVLDDIIHFIKNYDETDISRPDK